MQLSWALFAYILTIKQHLYENQPEDIHNHSILSAWTNNYTYGHPRPNICKAT